MDLENITAVPVVVFICYILAEIIKVIFGKHEKTKELLPLISSIVGAILTIILFVLFPEIVPAKSHIGALIIGLFSGLSATGSNQIWKQMNKMFKSKDESEKDE